jgi:hypothetical protein
VARESWLESHLLHYPGPRDQVDADTKQPGGAPTSRPKRKKRRPAKRDPRSLPDGARRPGDAAAVSQWRSAQPSGTLVPCLCLDVSTGELTMEMHEQAIPKHWIGETW